MKPFFSVIIPTYNSAILLKRAIQSVLDQTFKDFEIIVIDNSSEDNTESVVQSFNSKKIIFFSIKNKGVISVSRNYGIDIAKGLWLSFLDADDVWYINKLATIKNKILKNPNCILFCHNEFHVHINGQKKLYKYGTKNKNIYESLLFKGNCLSTSAVTVEKKIAFEVGKFSENKDFVSAEDYEFWIRLSKVGVFNFINEALGEFHLYAESASSDKMKHVNASMAVRIYHLNQWAKQFPQKKSKLAKGKGKLWADSARILNKDEQYSKSIQFVKQALRKDFFQLKAWAVLFLSIFRISVK